MKRGAVVGIIAAAVVVAAGVAVGIWALTRPPAAEAAAQQYLQALSNGDFDAVAELLDDRDENDLDALRASFDGASSYITAFDYRLGDAPDGQVIAEADIELADRMHQMTFALERSDGRWLLASGHLGLLEASSTLGDSVRVGDALVPVDTEIPLLPAVYPVAAAPSGILVGEAEAIVSTEEPVRVDVTAAVSAEASGVAQARVDEYAAACAEPASAVPPACGLRVPWAADLATLDALAFRIEQTPAVEIAADGRTFAATGGDIVATATGTDRAGGPASVTYRSDDWSLRGTVRFTGDEMVLRVG